MAPDLSSEKRSEEIDEANAKRASGTESIVLEQTVPIVSRHPASLGTPDLDA